MRLDKFLSETKTFTRSEAAKAVKSGAVSVNGDIAKKPDIKVDENADIITVNGIRVGYKKFIYIMLNKPEGYVSATEDKSAPFVTELVPPEIRRFGLFPIGRLDKYTVGLMLLSNDGELCYRLLSPKYHREKTYRFKCEKPLTDTEKLENGVHIEGGYLTRPCKICLESETQGEITITEGKYHQIKQMFYAVGNRITFLERVSLGGIALDSSLKRGKWRELNADELKTLKGEQ